METRLQYGRGTIDLHHWRPWVRCWTIQGTCMGCAGGIRGEWAPFESGSMTTGHGGVDRERGVKSGCGEGGVAKLVPARVQEGKGGLGFQGGHNESKGLQAGYQGGGSLQVSGCGYF